MKTPAAVVAVAASASAQTLTGPFSFVDTPMSADILSVSNAATPVSTRTADMTSTSSSTSVWTLPTMWEDSLDQARPGGWITIVRKDASTSDLESASDAAAATTNQMTTIVSTWDVSVVPTVKARGEPDIEEKLRSIFGDVRGGPSARTNSTSTSTSRPEEHPGVADPVATLRIEEHQDVLRNMTKATRTTQRQQPSKTPNPMGTMRAEEILDILREQTKSQEQQQHQAKMTTTQSRDLNVPMTTKGSMTTDAVATTTWDAESQPTIEHVEEFTRECGF